MKEIKYLLNSLFWAFYASTWWAAAKWGWNSTPNNPIGLLWLLPSILTVIVVISFVMYLCDNWNK